MINTQPYQPINPQPFQPINQVYTVPVQFRYSQVNQNHPTTYSNLPQNIKSQTSYVRVPSSINGVYEPLSKTNSQIVYHTQPLPAYQSPVTLHQSPPTQQVFYSNQKISPFQQSPGPVNVIRPPVIQSRISEFRRDMSPMDSSRYRKIQFSNNKHDSSMEKYDSLRWQNKYEDLKTKYFELLSIVQKQPKIEDSWLIEEQNKLLKQKIKLLEAKDQKYYNEVTHRIEKLISFHKQTTTQECSLLIDRFRLENKFLEKV